MLYEMLTGNPPHAGASVQQIIMKIVTDEARPVTELRKSVPVNVAAAAAKAVEKLPADRFESAKATDASERLPTLSPDGRWLAYVSNVSGREEVYVRPFP